MIVQQLAWNADLSAFLHWVIMGVIIAYINFGIKGWIKGLILGLVTAIPFVLIIGIDAAIPIFGMSAILGILVGILTDRFAR
jgi:hypothetical protein